MGMGTVAFCFLFGRAGKREKQGVVSGWRVHPGPTGGGGVFKAGLELGGGGYPVVHHDLIRCTIYCVIPIRLRSPGTANLVLRFSLRDIIRQTQTFDIVPYAHIETSNDRRSHAARYRCAGT
jgi:hypothetical protein